jgi:hypothetical protein
MWRPADVSLLELVTLGSAQNAKTKNDGALSFRATMSLFVPKHQLRLRHLIESVTIYPHGERCPEADVVAKVSDLLMFAPNDNAAREGGDCGWLRGQDLNL